MNKTGLNNLYRVTHLAPHHFNCWVLISLTGDEQGSPSFLFVLLLRSDAE